MIMEKLQECRRMILRTQWIDMQLMALRSATQRTASHAHLRGLDPQFRRHTWRDIRL